MIHTFVGPDWRVQVKVLEPRRFVLRALHAYERPQASFLLCGYLVHNSTDAAAALSALLERVPDARRQMPRKMRRTFGLSDVPRA